MSVKLERAIYTLSRPDYGLMRRVNRWNAPRWFRWWMLLATRAGDGWLWGLIGIAVLCSPADDRFVAIEASGFSVAAGIAVFQGAKRIFRRTRPRDIEPHCWACITTFDVFSFPSGHSTTAFAVAVSLGSFFPEVMPLLLILAANVAISRVVVGLHFMTDVLVGSGLGACIGYAAYQFAV
ncbi:MAG: phosphoesterase, PA-phosphatase related [Bryobacterales bacterium]|jgi:undecaprenyl-diphosphatase|nr:phosphoesterase, PA-phosphatase related [Bryobacterales bacterium]